MIKNRPLYLKAGDGEVSGGYPTIQPSKVVTLNIIILK